MLKYIYPCNPKPIDLHSEYFNKLDSDTSWIAGVKKNEWRADVYHDENGIVLWTKRQTILHDALPELRKELAEMIPRNTIVDGGLIEKRTKETKGKYYAFDLIMLEGKLLTDRPLEERRAMLDRFLFDTEHIEVEKWVQIGKKNLYYQSIEGELNEGIVIKKLNSKYYASYRACQDNPFWIKVKKPENAVKTKEA